MQIQQPKKCRNGRYRFDDEIKINNTDSMSKFEEDEYPSENLENHLIRAIVERNDSYGLPSTLTLKFKLSQNEIFTTLSIKILPSVINAQKDDSKAVFDYVHFQTHEDVQERTRALKKSNPQAYEQALQENVQSIVDYIKRELCIKYLLIKRSNYPDPHNKTVLRYLENLSILREFKLDQIEPGSIEAKKLMSLSYIVDPDEKEKEFYAVEGYSKEIQKKSRESGKRIVSFAYVNDNETLVGLKVGRTPEETARFAIEDARANENKLGVELVNTEIFSRYTTGRVMERPQEMQ